MSLKTLFIPVFLLIFVVGCKSRDVPKKVDPYKTLTSSYVKESCTPPGEFYPLQVLGIPTLLTRYVDCHNVGDLILISWLGDFDDIGIVTTDLLSLHFTRYLNTSGDKECKMSLLKRENVPVDRIHSSFYSVMCKVVKQDE